MRIDGNKCATCAHNLDKTGLHGLRDNINNCLHCGFLDYCYDGEEI